MTCIVRLELQDIKLLKRVLRSYKYLLDEHDQQVIKLVKEQTKRLKLNSRKSEAFMKTHKPPNKEE